MDLHPGAVELGLESRCPAEPFERVGNAGRGLGEHRPDRTADLERKAVERGAALGQRGGGDGRQIAAQHRRPPHRRRGDVGGLGDRVGHDAEQRALPQLAAEQATQERLLGAVAAANRLVEQRPGGPGSPGPRPRRSR